MTDFSGREKSSTIRQLEYILDRILKDREPLVVSDHVKESISLVEEWIDICREIDIPMYVSILECEEDIYPIVISQFPLTGGDTEMVKEKYVEFRDHKWKQRTWVPYFADYNNKASWAVFTYLTEYTYYIGVPEKAEIAGIAQSKRKYAPILWVAASDGQCEAQEDNIRHSIERDTPTGEYIIQAERIYAANIIEKALARIKTLTQEVASKDISYEEMDRNREAHYKKQTAKTLSMALRVEEVQREGLSGAIVRLFSNKIVTYLFYAFVIFIVLNFLTWVINMYAGGPFLPSLFNMAPAGGGTVGGAETVTAPITTTPVP